MSSFRALMRCCAGLAMALMLTLSGPLVLCSAGSVDGTASCAMACCQSQEMSCCSPDQEPDQPAPAPLQVETSTLVLAPVDIVELPLSIAPRDRVDLASTAYAAAEHSLSLLIKLCTLQP